MKPIEKVQIWFNGESKTANLLNASISFDNMESACSFFYQLHASGEGTEEMPVIIGEILAGGTVNMTGESYLSWIGDNDAAYDFIADHLNLTIIKGEK